MLLGWSGGWVHGGAHRWLTGLWTLQLINDFFKELKEPNCKIIFCNISLLYLSRIFSPHAIRSRYPQENFNPLDVYNDEMPLVQMLDSFIKITEETLEKLDYLYTEMPKAMVRKWPYIQKNALWGAHRISFARTNMLSSHDFCFGQSKAQKFNRF